MRQSCLPLVLFMLLGTVLAGPAYADRRADAKAQVAFGIRVLQSRLLREAKFRFERAIAIDPSYANAWNNLAIVYEQTGEHDKARMAYEQALKLAPNDTIIRQNYDLFAEIHDRMTTPPLTRASP